MASQQTNHSMDETATHCVGPYMLGRTLGKGQTGLVKLGVHCKTKRTAAVKIVNRSKLSKSVLMKVEREIAIMKLIDHPHVLGLYDVYENSTYLYLVLEHVSGGELFDYLVKRGRLMEKEAKRFFSQIISAVNFCHKHAICHRDLKPENLLLDENKNIKVADFGMASLQVRDHMLETSCGSPHYACPEVIRGEQYDGRKADVWSCGVILFALLVGALPFDDDNLRVLLEKVKRGEFRIPSFVPSPAQELIRGMVHTNPAKRLTMDDVIKHPWVISGGYEIETIPRMEQAVQTVPLQSRSEIDPDIFKSMASLGCFKDKHALIRSLMCEEPTEEKVIYFLLLLRKENRPSLEDDLKAPALGDELLDPPRKRLDSSVNTSQVLLDRVRSHSIGSPFSNSVSELPQVATSPRTGMQSPAKNPQGYYSYSPSGNRSRTSVPTMPVGTTPPGSPWKRRISTIRSFVGSPRFHRRKLDGTEPPATPDVPEINEVPSSPISRSPPTVKKSWFANLVTSSGEKEEVIVIYQNKSFIELRASAMGACAACSVNCTELSDNSFKLKYDSKSKGKPVFKKTVKMTLTINAADDTITHANGDIPQTIPETYTVTFTHIAGSPRRFKKLCERIQVAILRPFLLMDKRRSQDKGPLMSSDDMLSYHSNGDTDRLTPTQIVITKETNGRSSSSGSNNLLGDSSDNESDDDLLDE